MFANRPNLYQELDQRNLIPRMEGVGLIRPPGRYIHVEDMKVHRTGGLETETSWIYVNPPEHLNCIEYQLMVKAFGFIPRQCRECYKVVVIPRSFHELMLLLDLEEKIVSENTKVWCKCGIERRDFVNRNYGGYFYTRGLDTGKIRYQTVREMVDKYISPDVNVILKRFCTEYELMFGPSDQYQAPPDANEIENRFWETTAHQPCGYKQPPFVRDHIVQMWMMFAWGRGDKTVMLYNDGKPLFQPVVTYHQGKE